MSSTFLKEPKAGLASHCISDGVVERGYKDLEVAGQRSAIFQADAQERLLPTNLEVLDFKLPSVRLAEGYK